jgi:hypothetical protein
LDFNFALGDGAATTQFAFDAGGEVCNVVIAVVRFECVNDLHDFTTTMSGGPSDVDFSGRFDSLREGCEVWRTWREVCRAEIEGGERILKSRGRT